MRTFLRTTLMWSEGEEEEKSDDEEYDDDDDDFIGGSEKDLSEGEDEQLSTGIDDIDGEEEDGVLDIEIEGLQQSRVDGHKKGEKQDEVTAATETLKPELLSPFGRKLSVWDTTKYISKWKLAHIRGYHYGTYNQDEAHKNLLMQRETDCKTSIPLPIVCMMETEALRILEKMEKTYRSEFGANHQLTKDVQERIEAVRAQVAVKCAFDSTSLNLTGWKKWLGTLVTSKEKDGEDSKPPPSKAGELTPQPGRTSTATKDKDVKDSKLPQPGWSQWLGSLWQRTPTATEDKDVKDSKLPQPGWSQWLWNLISTPPATETKVTKAKVSRKSGQTPTKVTKTKVSLKSGQTPISTPPATETKVTKTKVSLKSGQTPICTPPATETKVTKTKVSLKSGQTPISTPPATETKVTETKVSLKSGKRWDWDLSFEES